MTNVDTIKKGLINLTQAAELLGLKYHHARKILKADNTIGCYVFGRKKLWNKCDIIELRNRHFVQPSIA